MARNACKKALVSIGIAVALAWLLFPSIWTHIIEAFVVRGNYAETQLCDWRLNRTSPDLMELSMNRKLQRIHVLPMRLQDIFWGVRQIEVSYVAERGMVGSVDVGLVIGPLGIRRCIVVH